MSYSIHYTCSNIKDIIYNQVESTINNEIIGHEEIKKLIVKILKLGISKSRFKKMHLLLNGSPATGKTVFIKTIFNALGPDHCIYYDASMSSQVGLLDNLDNHKDLESIRFICLDELDKMPEKHQYGILNALELGIMQETKFRRHREVNLQNITFFATSNDINKVIEPLQTRFLVVNVEPYTEQQFHDIALKLLTTKYRIDNNLAEAIIKAVVENIPHKTLRTVVQIASLTNSIEDINNIIELFDDE